MDPWAVVGIAATIICGLIGVIYWSGRSRDEKQDEALAEHVKDDIKAHERLTAMETEVSTLKVEVGKLRDMRHDILDQVSHSLASWYTSIVEMINRK